MRTRVWNLVSSFEKGSSNRTHIFSCVREEKLFPSRRRSLPASCVVRMRPHGTSYTKVQFPPPPKFLLDVLRLQKSGETQIKNPYCTQRENLIDHRPSKVRRIRSPFPSLRESLPCGISLWSSRQAPLLFLARRSSVSFDNLFFLLVPFWLHCNRSIEKTAQRKIDFNLFMPTFGLSWTLYLWNST